MHISQNLQSNFVYRIRQEVDSMLRKIQNGFRTSRSTSRQIFTIRRIIEGVNAKMLHLIHLFIYDFSKAFNNIHRGKMKEILTAYGKPEETVIAIMIFYLNTIKNTIKSTITGLLDIRIH